MDALSRFVTGRRSKWVVIGIWIVAVVAMAGLGSKLADVTTDDTESFLPKDVESTDVVKELKADYPRGETSTGLIVYRREGGLTPQDMQRIGADAKAIEGLGPSQIPLKQTPIAPAATSPDGTVATLTLIVPVDFEHSGDWGKNVRKVTTDAPGRPPGLETFVTGDLGFSADADEVFGDLDAKLLFATVLLVLVLLGLIYRAVLAAITPLIVVGFAYNVATGLIYLYAKSGQTVSSQSTGILIVLMFGVGTDYCLLLVSRYREELRRMEDKHDAMQRALRRTGPAIFASGCTVSLAMLAMLLADAGDTHSLGPIAAISVLSTMVAGLTLLPALLTWFGRKAFWPRRGTVEYDPDHTAETRQSAWRRFGDRVLHRPAPALIVTGLLFVAGAFGVLAYKADFSTTSFFKTKQESIEGFDALSKSLPAGGLAPSTALIKSADGPITNGEIQAAVQKLQTVKGVASAKPTGQTSSDGTGASIDVTLDQDPNTLDSLDLVPDIRDSIKQVAPGVTGELGGSTAINYDLNQVTEKDLERLAPVAILIIFIILALLLRALVAPVVLILSVILSFLCTMGVSMLFIRYVVGDAGLYPSIPTYAFIFLVALGIDYTIFLMARVREEAATHGTREGMLRAIGATGPVITSAGLILAGTFSVLMTLPVTFTFDLGFMVAVGILLDTFIVRTIMVPAAIELLGDRAWWPSDAQGGGKFLQEDTGEHPVPASGVS
jgi:RND superfamily putative drug exporter